MSTVISVPGTSSWRSDGGGATPSYLAKALDCPVVGADLLERMIGQPQDRVRTNGIEDRVAFAVADARNLPFQEGTFYAVIMESLNVFVDDKVEAVHEYVRATRPGGCVGITEMAWLRTPSPETAAYYKRVVYADSLEVGAWIELPEQAGLEDVVGSAQPVNIPQEAKGRFERYGGRGFVKVLVRALSAALRDRASRAFLRDVIQSLPRGMLADIGYGVFSGRKRE